MTSPSAPISSKTDFLVGDDAFLTITYAEVTRPVYLVNMENSTVFNDFLYLVGNASPIAVSIIDDTINEVEVFRTGLTVTALVWSLYAYMCLIVIILTYKLHNFLRIFGIQASIPQICICLDLISLFSKPHSSVSVLTFSQSKLSNNPLVPDLIFNVSNFFSTPN